jgi:hypothetical protein
VDHDASGEKLFVFSRTERERAREDGDASLHDQLRNYLSIERIRREKKLREIERWMDG